VVGFRFGCCFSYRKGTVIGMDGYDMLDNQPVVLVVMEIRHTSAGPVRPPAQMRIKNALAKDFPLLHEATLTTFKSVIGAQTDVSHEKAPKFMSRDRTSSVTFRGEAIVIETTRYPGYQRFRRWAAAALRARQEASPIDGAERVGLRYVNEIRVPEVGSNPADWASWVHPSLLGPVSLGEQLGLGLTAAQAQGLVLYGVAPDRGVVLRYGPREGYAIEQGDLKRPLPPPGPFFLIDLDSAWSAGDEVPEVEVEWLLDLCDELHRPVRGLFDALVTDKLRTEVFTNATPDAEPRPGRRAPGTRRNRR
jgi:uncharacterized protein (TIGR04255 family)